MMKRSFALLLFCALTLPAQVDTGVITGTLTDPSGAVLAGAAVTLRNEATGIQTRLSSNSLGQYVSPPLRPGPYSITAELRGFRRTETKIELTLAQRAVVDLGMPVGAIEERVTVEATAPLLESETATVSNLRDERTIQDLPLNTRNFNQLVALAPGVVPAQLQAGSPAITAIRGTTANSVNGMGFRANNYLVDGMDNSENHNGQGILIYPPVDAIQEFRVQTSVTNAEFGRGGGGTVNVSYKSGGRDIHGDAFEFLRNSAMDAKNFFDRPGKIAPFRLNQFGGTLGGPVVLPFYNRSRNRTFFFVAYEGVRRDQALTYLVTVPLPAFRQGNFSAAKNRVYDPLTTRPNPAGSGQIRDLFPGNVVPQSRIDPIGQKLANLYPDPNLGGLTSNYSSNPAQPVTSNNVDIKIDQNFSTRDQAFFRYSRHNTEQLIPGSLPLPAVGNTAAGNSIFPLHQFVASYTHTLSPNKINEFRAGVTRLNITTRHLNWGHNVDEELGIPGVNVKNDILTSGLSRVNVAGYEGLGDSGNRTAMIISENYQWNDAFTWIHGAHTIKFGGQVGRRRYNMFQDSNLRGVFTVSSIYSTNPATPSGTGDGMVDLLLGAPQSEVNSYTTGTRGYRRTEFGAFAQDTWKITSALTLNLGLRYEVYNAYPWKEVFNRMSNFLPQLGNVYTVGSPELPQESATNSDLNDFGPRVGLAYKLGKNAVVRAGYGVFYSAEAIPATSLGGANPPFVGSVTYNNSQFDFAGARRIAQGFRPLVGVVFSPIGAQLQSIDPNFRTPYGQQWNSGIQYNLTRHTLLSVSYVGTSGKHLVLDPNLNQPRPGPTAVASRRPWPQFANIRWVESAGSSVYHSLQISAERRMSSGLSFLAGYTWSHALDNGAFLSDFQDSLNLNAERGNADIDMRHRLVVSSLYELPVGHGRRFLNSAPQVADLILGGWQINAISNFYTGLDFTPSSLTNTLNGSGNQRPDRIGNGTLGSSARSIRRWFDLAAFTTPGPFLFGNAGRDILFGPGTVQFDTSLFKNFYFTKERSRRVELRGEFFNVTNTPHFNNPNGSIGNPAAGTISAAGSKTTFQRTERQIQLGLKLYW